MMMETSMDGSTDDPASTVRHLRSRKKKEKQIENDWKIRMSSHLTKTRGDIILRILFYFRTRTVVLTLFIIISLIITILYFIFEFGAHNIEVNGKPLWAFFRLLMVTCNMMIILWFILTFLYFIFEKLVQFDILIAPTVFKLSLIFLITGAIMYGTFDLISEDNYERGKCNEDDTSDTDSDTDSDGGLLYGDTESDAEAIVNGLCLDFEFWFLLILIIGIFWFIRNLIEEFIIYYLKVRPIRGELALMALQEHYLRILGKYMRERHIIPPRNDEKNPIPDFYLKGYRNVSETNLVKILKHDKDIRVQSLIGSATRTALNNQSTVIYNYLKKENDELTRDKFNVINWDNNDIAFDIFNRSGGDTISLNDFIYSIDSFYMARRRIWLTYQSRRKLAQLARRLVGVVFWIVMFIIGIVLAGVSLSIVIFPTASLVLGLSFAFGPIAQHLVESFMLVLVDKPYAIGERIKIGYRPNQISNIITDISLFRTFVRTADGIAISIPNSKLFDSEITNYTQSQEYSWMIDIEISSHTPGNTLLEFKSKIEEYINSHSDTFEPSDSLVWLEKYSNMNSITLSMWLHMNGILWSRFEEYSNVKTEFILFLQKLANRLQITLTQVPQIFQNKHFE